MSCGLGIEQFKHRLAKMAPEGYFFGLHIRQTQPLLYEVTFPRQWMEHYMREAYALRDPIIAWGLGQVGSSRWSAIDIPDPVRIMDQARKFGMTYGFAVSCGEIGSRTIASATRSDREFTDDEIAAFEQEIVTMHNMTTPPESLTDAQTQALRRIAEGDRYAAAAAKLGISESALKARLLAARTNLMARTTVEAIQKARDFRLL